MASAAQEVDLPSSSRRTRARVTWRGSFAWIGVLPFFAYVAVFLLIPTVWLAIGAFQDNNGNPTLSYVRQATQDQYLSAFETSLKLGLVSALTSGIAGLFIAYAAVKDGSPRWIRALISTFSGVAANFAGVPLAFAFVATIGPGGMLTSFFATHGMQFYDSLFITTFVGLILVYTYFQLPLMILIISPAIDGLRKEWRDAATNLGTTTFQFWLWVGIPILWPSLLGAMVLLFGSAFSAYATAAALTGGTIGLVPIDIANVLNGNFVEDLQLGDALALGMILIIGLSMVIYVLLQRRSSRWMR
jgi:putative spermidine/putrescine transport system permease protein